MAKPAINYVAIATLLANARMDSLQKIEGVAGLIPAGAVIDLDNPAFAKTDKGDKVLIRDAQEVKPFLSDKEAENVVAQARKLTDRKQENRANTTAIRALRFMVGKLKEQDTLKRAGEKLLAEYPVPEKVKQLHRETASAAESFEKKLVAFMDECMEPKQREKADALWGQLRGLLPRKEK